MARCFVISLFILFILNDEIIALEKVSRQKRCIVIQKQSGGRADSGEGNDDEDYDFKKPLPKEPPLDRLQTARIEEAKKKKGDVEAISPEPLKFKTPPNMGMFRRLKLKNRLRNFFQ